VTTTQPEALRDEHHETVDDLKNRYAETGTRTRGRHGEAVKKFKNDWQIEPGDPAEHHDGAGSGDDYIKQGIRGASRWHQSS
jgi:hypothetical protein